MFSLKVVILVTTSLLACSAWCKTFVIVENKTSIKLHFETTQSGYSLSRNHWDQLAFDIEPDQTRSILGFNRDIGIKRGKTFLFTTRVSSDLNDGEKINLLQLLQGRTVNSHLWQSLTTGNQKVVWNDTRDSKHIGVTINGKPIRVSYRAVSDGTNDNIIYSFKELPQGNIGEEENKLSILNYNIYMRPIALFKNGQFIRAEFLPEVISGNDVVNFSEAFDDDVRDLLISRISNEYPYRTKVVGKDKGFKQDGGVLIVSRWPIIEEDEYLFGDLCFKDFEDCLSNKGIGYAKILKGSKFYHIFATHMQAGYTQKDKNVRRAQLRKFKQFIDSKNINKDEPVIMTGDFNVHRKELDEKEDNFDALEVLNDVLNLDEGWISDSSVKNNYALMLKILKASGLPHTGHSYSYDPTVNKLGKSSDPAELVEHIMFSDEHRTPISASQKVIIAKSKTPWRQYVWEDFISDLSDHFPVRAEFQF
ncbi:MAG TPA: sphingomyelin phosphodiesterase [Bacteriovoracaceae bacterium]|nr:sphingomyelin phosphodiesterase [Bacteriovoracaceae bacterium]